MILAFVIGFVVGSLAGGVAGYVIKRPTEQMPWRGWENGSGGVGIITLNDPLEEAIDQP